LCRNSEMNLESQGRVGLEDVEELGEESSGTDSSILSTTVTTTDEVATGHDGVEFGAGGKVGLLAVDIASPASCLVVVVEGAGEIGTGGNATPLGTCGGTGGTGEVVGTPAFDGTIRLNAAYVGRTSTNIEGSDVEGDLNLRTPTPARDETVVTAAA